MMHARQTESTAGVFQADSLWQRLQSTSARALQNGALEPIESQTISWEDQGVEFLIRVVSRLRDKPAGADNHNPFLPYEDSLHVADVSSTHACILNKYNVVDFHLLIITRLFEHQETLLTRRDFHALCRCLLEYDSLGFYNSGSLAGASQKHKHLQLVPLPLSTAGSKGLSLTLISLLDRASCPVGEITQIETLPYRHAFVRCDIQRSGDCEQAAESSLEDYRTMMRHVGADVPETPDELVSTPYNLLVTRRWMLLVPRVRECFGDISLNSLAFAGALLVRNAAQLERLRAAGPCAALQSVAPLGADL